MSNDRHYDGHISLFGMDADTDPSFLAPQLVSRSVNRIFRGGINRTRPPFRHWSFLFSNSEHEEIVKFGKFQGWMPYERKKPGSEDGIVVSISGNIYFFAFVNEQVLVRNIYSGNDVQLAHTWFVQAEDWVYIQNGKDKPIAWDGTFPSTARRLQSTDGEMPIGTIMEYFYGRVWLTNAYNQIIASDQIFGSGITRTDNTKNFTETEYWAGGGYFVQPTNLGTISGALVIPRQSQNLTGQGELVIMSTKGATAFNGGIPRSQWIGNNIQVVALAGRGCIAHKSVIAVNNDLWFRSKDGISSYQASRSELAQQPVFDKLSRAVNRWLLNDTEWLRQHCSMLYFNNRVYCTTQPEISEGYIYHKGLIVLDLDPASGVSGDSGFNWDGLWTGLRTCGLISLGSNAFSFSFDSDRQNRMYQIDAKGNDDCFEGENKKIKSFYITKRFDWQVTNRTHRFETKQLLGGELLYSELKERSTIKVDYRPDSCEVWTSFVNELEFGPDLGSNDIFTYPYYGKIKFATPSSNCFLGQPSNHASQFQFMVSGLGQFTIDGCRFGASINNDANSSVGDCKDKPSNLVIDGTVEDEYSYDIVD